MNTELLKRVGNIDQLAGIREVQLLRGRGEGTALAEFYNAAGLRFSVVPDRCSDIFDLSYRGVNISFQSKNGLVSPLDFSSVNGDFSNQWPGGMLVTCGLDNVGEHCGNNPTHGRISHIPAQSFGTKTYWDGDRYILRSESETHQASLYGSHLSLRRCIETEANSKVLTICDTITNSEDAEAPYLLLYHCNFGYPLLQATSRVKVSAIRRRCLSAKEGNPFEMSEPVMGADEELYLYKASPAVTTAVLYNEFLELGAYLRFHCENLPNMLQWKLMKTHDYVLAFEPCNFSGENREKAMESGSIPVLAPYCSVENRLELGILDGLSEIHAFIKNI